MPEGNIWLLALMLVFESHGGLVAYFGGTEVLDGAGVYVAGVFSPLLALRSKFQEGAPSRRTRAFWITGFILPLRRSMFIIMVMGIPPATHCTEGLVRLRTLDI